jgi:hypothetical protein
MRNWNALDFRNLERAARPEGCNKKPEKFGTPPSVVALRV